jgi:hypothetical protein
MSAAALETPFWFGWPRMDDAGGMLGFCLKKSREIFDDLAGVGGFEEMTPDRVGRS